MNEWHKQGHLDRHLFSEFDLSLQGTKWDDYFIFIAGTLSSHVVYLLHKEKLDSASAVKLLPIQKLPRHGIPKSVSFVKLDDTVYCFLGSNLPEENQ